MYSNPFQAGQIKKALRVLVIASLAVFLMWLAVDFLLSGFVDSSSIKSLYSLEFDRMENGKIAETTIAKPGYTHLRAGAYNVKITSGDATRAYSTASVRVSNFFHISTLQFTEQKQSSSQYLSPVTNSSFVSNANSLASFSMGSSFVTDDNNPLAKTTYTCEQVCMSLYSYDDSRIIGLVGNQSDTKSIATITPPSTTPVAINEQKYAPNSTLIRSQFDNSFAVYQGEKHLYFYKDASSAPVDIALANAPAQGEDDYLISVTGDSVLVASGVDYSNPTSGDGGYGTATDKVSGYTFDTYVASTGKRSRSFTLKDHTQIRSISLSPGAKYYTVATLLSYEVGTVTTGEITVTKPYNISSILWSGPDRFVYYDTNAIYMSNVSGDTWPIFANKSINISHVELVSGMLHVGAIFTDDPDQQLSAIIVDVSKTAIDNSLLSYSPLQLTSYYSIRFDGQRFNLYITSASDGSKPNTDQLQPAYDYMKKTAPSAQIVTYQ